MYFAKELGTKVYGIKYIPKVFPKILEMCKKEMVSWITFFKDYNKRIYEKLPDNLAVEKNLEAGDH